MTAAVLMKSPPLPAAPLWRAGLRFLSPAGASARLSIVLFHRVLPNPDPMFPEEMHRTRFDAICGWLARWFCVLPLDEAVQRLHQGSLPERALCITFDDGYADNHDVAMPVLQSHGLTATFFIACSFLDGGRMWNDTIVESVRLSQKGALDLSGLDTGLGALIPLTSLDDRRRLAMQLLDATKYLEPAQRQAMADRIAERSGATLPSSLMMSSIQLQAMARAGMQIGAHTLTHPILARIDEADARREIAESKGQLEALLGQRMELFAYPNGKPGRDYTARDVELVRQAGFAAAVSTAYGAARSGQDSMFQLPRFTPWDQDRTRFGLRLARNFFAKPDSV